MSSEEEATAANVLSQMSQMQQISACETIDATVVVGHHCDVETSGTQENQETTTVEVSSEVLQQVQAAFQHEMPQLAVTAGYVAVSTKPDDVTHDVIHDHHVQVLNDGIQCTTCSKPGKSYTCEHCGKKFNKSYNLKTHIRVHTGERPYQCEVCGHGFANLGDLKRHSRTHTGEKPFKVTVLTNVTLAARNSTTSPHTNVISISTKIANQESQTDGSGLVTDVDDEVSMEDAEGQTAADNLSKVALSQLEADSKSSGHRNGKPELIFGGNVEEVGVGENTKRPSNINCGSGSLKEMFSVVAKGPANGKGVLVATMLGTGSDGAIPAESNAEFTIEDNGAFIASINEAINSEDATVPEGEAGVTVGEAATNETSIKRIDTKITDTSLLQQVTQVLGDMIPHSVSAELADGVGGPHIVLQGTDQGGGEFKVTLAQQLLIAQHILNQAQIQRSGNHGDDEAGSNAVTT
ncbi:hypothetical protein QZH41_017597, partial [Actinostola sp. cb2023]